MYVFMPCRIVDILPNQCQMEMSFKETSIIYNISSENERHLSKAFS